MQYEVHFLIEKTIMVDAIDDIQAELKAVKWISPLERKNIRGVQYTDSSFDSTIPIKEFSEPDLDWWAEHDLLDNYTKGE